MTEMVVTGYINGELLQELPLEDALLIARHTLLDEGPMVSGSIHFKIERRPTINGWHFGVFGTPST